MFEAPPGQEVSEGRDEPSAPAHDRGLVQDVREVAGMLPRTGHPTALERDSFRRNRSRN
jgi:hypothetical protein